MTENEGVTKDARLKGLRQRCFERPQDLEFHALVLFSINCAKTPDPAAENESVQIYTTQ